MNPTELFVIRNSDSHEISQFADGINYRNPPKEGPELLMPVTTPTTP